MASRRSMRSKMPWLTSSMALLTAACMRRRALARVWDSGSESLSARPGGARVAAEPWLSVVLAMSHHGHGSQRVHVT